MKKDAASVMLADLVNVKMMSKILIDHEEKDILESYQLDEWQPVENFIAETHRLKEYARATFKKDARINIRISTKDLEAVQKKALEEGIPYQTLISSIIHKYISGRFVERS